MLSDDFEHMLQRARLAGLKSMIVTGGSLKESKEALKVAKTYSELTLIVYRLSHYLHDFLNY